MHNKPSLAIKYIAMNRLQIPDIPLLFEAMWTCGLCDVLRSMYIGCQMILSSLTGYLQTKLLAAG